MSTSPITLNPSIYLRSVTLLDRLFVVFSLIFFSLPQTTIGISNNQIIVNLIMLNTTLFMSLPIMNNLIKTILLDKILLVFLCYCCLSLLWSASPIATTVFLLKVITATLFAYYVVSKFGVYEFFRYVTLFLIISAILSLALGILLPQHFVHQGINHHGEWRGIFGHKNGLGTICVVGIFTMQIWLFSKSMKSKKLAFIMLSVFVVLLFLSSSRTAIVVSLICIFIPLIYSIYRSLYKIHKSLFVSFLMFGILGTSGIIVLITTNLNLVFSLLDRTPTLTGRTEIWAVVRDFIMQKFWFGYGGNGFWYSNYALDIWSILNYPALTSSHSGIYDFLLDFGVVGFGLMLIHYLFVMARTIKSSFTKGGVINWFLVFVLFLLINNISDSRFLNTTSIFWLLYVCSALYTKKIALK